jgi:cytoskeletal protein CcmA (bactofilin family)
VRTRATLYVVPDAVVDAKVRAVFAIIGGNFKGEVQCEARVDLLSSCRAQGKVVTRGLTVQSGALFDGAVEMTEKSPPKRA